tara:strand:+ start:30155 stop:30970 length:816 start_codon:yes stop_codon:yes gene_type:complete
LQEKSTGRKAKPFIFIGILKLQGLEHLDNQFERAEYFQSLLIARATGGEADDGHYQLIRHELLNSTVIPEMLPRWIKTKRNLDQFWQFIKSKFSTYEERRRFIWNETNPILEFLESGLSHPAQKTIDEVLSDFDSDSIHFAWSKALERKLSDPEGAITISRTILESVCKHILDDKGIQYNFSNIELSELYKLTAKELNLSPDQHNEQIFKQILGGCSGIVNGLGTLRNKLGDAHGKGMLPVKPQARHAELAVNLAGSMALFLISTHANTKV